MMKETIVNMNEEQFDSTPPLVTEVDMSAERGPTPHPALDGRRVKLRGGVTIWFVWRGGYKTHVPDPTVYNNLFRSWDGFVELPADEIANIATGFSLAGATMVRGRGTSPVYLVARDQKHHVTAPAVMDYCNFKWPTEANLLVVEPIFIDPIPPGAQIA